MVFVAVECPNELRVRRPAGAAILRADRDCAIGVVEADELHVTWSGPGDELDRNEIGARGGDRHELPGLLVATLLVLPVATTVPAAFRT